MRFLNWLFTASKDMPITTGAEGRKFVAVKPDPYAGFTSDDWSSAGLDIVYPLGLDTDDSFWNGSVAECDAVLARIAKYRIQYAKQEPKKFRSAIMYWLDHYEYKAKENRSDCVTQAKLKRHEDYCRRSDEKNARKRRLTDVLRQEGHL